MAAPTSRLRYTTSASASTSRRCMPTSSCRVRLAASEMTRWLSTPSMACKCCSIRTPYTAPVAPVMATTRRRGRICPPWASGIEQGFQFARFKHLVHDVRAADEFALDVELGNGRPVGKILDALTHFRIVQHIDGGDVLHAAGLQDLDGTAGKAALGKLRGALHEQHDRRAADGLFDPGLYIAHDCLW